MRKIFLSLLFLPLTLFAQGGQLNGSGYYRVQNVASGRYFSIVDNKSTYVGANKDDLNAFLMLEDFEANVAHNPATICYFEQTSGGYNLLGQDLNLYNLAGTYLQTRAMSGGSYRLYGTSSTVVIYLVDYTAGGWTHPATGGGKLNWYLLPVNQTDTQYFGIKPDVQATFDGAYWNTTYAGFSFKPSNSKDKVYRVDRIVGSYAIIKEITGLVPQNTPVLVKTTTSAPSQNKMTLQYSTAAASSVGSNLLRGNFYCNDEEGQPQHRNLTAYNPQTMRVLGVSSSGKPAFVKSDIQYLPANKCYLQVAANAPDVIRIVTEEEYAVAGINDVTLSTVDANAPVFDLQGRRVANPQKGVFIQGGKKIVVR